MTRYVLDTTFVIDFLRGDRAAVERFEAMFENGDEPLVNEIIACEAWTAAPIDGDPALQALLAAVEFVQPGLASARDAGSWRQSARSRGQVLSLADALIAAAAYPEAAVLTRNLRDFALTPVRVESY
ncbi:MAG TPA: PIN domain-containing protein [Candidatus Limnocylindria bacterium]|nr:PIN domain-containing protein [Candidatus Limnocylindria bacterium]